MRKLLVVAALLALASPVAADETLGVGPCDSKGEVAFAAVTAASSNLDAVACHAALEVRIALTGGTGVDWEIQTCGLLGGSLVCDALAPAVSGSLAPGGRAVRFLTIPVGRIRIALTNNDGSVAVGVVGHPR